VPYNGSCYRAHETIDFADRLGLVPCFTPVRSLQSKGMAEAFVKIFKRDYVYVHDRPDAQTALSPVVGMVRGLQQKLSAQSSANEVTP
jgi:transposase InsO family protein